MLFCFVSLLGLEIAHELRIPVKVAMDTCWHTTVDSIEGVTKWVLQCDVIHAELQRLKLCNATPPIIGIDIRIRDLVRHYSKKQMLARASTSTTSPSDMLAAESTSASTTSTTTPSIPSISAPPNHTYSSSATSDTFTVFKGNHPMTARAMESMGAETLIKRILAVRKRLAEEHEDETYFDVKLQVVVDGDTSLNKVLQTPETASLISAIYRDAAHLVKNVYKAINCGKLRVCFV